MATLQRHISEKIAARKHALSVPDRHMLRISRQSMNMSCVGLRILGGPKHHQAASNIERLTGQIVGIASDCTCNRG